MLQINADARKEMTARNLANGSGHFVSKLYRLVCRHQNEARQAKVGGKFCTFDPRTWNSDLRVTVFAGGINREHSLMGLQLIGMEQEKVIEALGPGNPNVTAKNRFRYQEELCRAAGWKTAEPFFTEVPDELVTDEQGQPVVDPETGEPQMKPWSPPPQPDPALAKVQADAEAKKAEIGLRTEETKANLALEGQKSQAQLEQDAQKAALDIELAREKAAAETALAREKAQAEIDLAWAKFEAEQALAREKMQAEMEIARMQVANDREKHAEKIEADVEISKNREGGSLSE